MAFGAVDYKTHEGYLDLSRIEWVVTLDEYKNLKVQNTRHLKFHVCTSEDFDEYYPIVDQDSAFLEDL